MEERRIRDIPKGDQYDYLRDPETHIARFKAFADSIGMRDQIMGKGDGIPIGEHSPFHDKEILSSSSGSNPYIDMFFAVNADAESHTSRSGDFNYHHMPISGYSSEERSRFGSELMSRGPTHISAQFFQHPMIGFTNRSIGNIEVSNLFKKLETTNMRQNPTGVETITMRQNPDIRRIQNPIKAFTLSDVPEKLKEVQGAQNEYFRTRESGAPEGYDEFFKKVQQHRQNPMSLAYNEDEVHMFSPQFLRVSDLGSDRGTLISHKDLIDLNTGTWAK